MPTHPSRRSLLRQVVTLLFVGIIAWYIYVNWHDFAVILEISVQELAVIIGVLFLNRLVNAAHFAMLYQGLGAKVSIWESYGLSTVTATLNLVLPAQAGGVARAVYLKQKHAVPYSYTPTLFLGSVVFSLSIGAFLLLLANTLLLLTGMFVPLIFWLVPVCAAASIMLFKVTIPEWLTSRLGRVGRILQLANHGWQQLAHNKHCLLKAGVYQIVTYITLGLSLTIIYSSLGISVHLLLATSIAVVLSLSNLVLITPGNIGVQEAVIGYLSILSGLTFVQGVAVSAIIRVVILAINFVVAPAAWYILFSRGQIAVSWSALSGKKPNAQPTPK